MPRKVQRYVGPVNSKMLGRPQQTAYQEAFGRRLKSCREAAGYESQAEFARVLGMTTEGYRLYETGQRQPRFSTLVEIAERLDKTLDFLILGKRQE